MYFSSKKDIWMGVLIWLFILLIIVPPIFCPDFESFKLPDFSIIGVAHLILPLSGSSLLLWFWFGTGYWIKGTDLKITYGPIRKSINIQTVTSIRATKNPFADPALSMDKIEINYGKYDTVAISPKDKRAFINQLLKLNPNIKIDDSLMGLIE